MRRTPLVVRVPRFGAAHSSFASGDKSACDASVISEYTYRDFLKTSGFTALPYAKVCHFCVIFLSSFVGKFWNKHPAVKMPSVRHWKLWTIVREHNIWNFVSTKLFSQFLDICGCCSTC